MDKSRGSSELGDCREIAGQEIVVAFQAGNITLRNAFWAPRRCSSRTTEGRLQTDVLLIWIPARTMCCAIDLVPNSRSGLSRRISWTVHRTASCNLFHGGLPTVRSVLCLSPIVFRGARTALRFVSRANLEAASPGVSRRVPPVS